MAMVAPGHQIAVVVGHQRIRQPFVNTALFSVPVFARKKTLDKHLQVFFILENLYDPIPGSLISGCKISLRVDVKNP